MALSRLPFKNILFDLDGTLTDPKEGITRCIQYALERLDGPQIPSEDLLFCIGPPLRVTFPQLLQTDDKDTIEQAVSLYRERFSTVGLFENTVYPGIQDMLAYLENEGADIWLATSKPRVYAERILKRFSLHSYFTGLYGSEMDGRLDQKTDLIAHIFTEENLLPGQSLMIGDRSMDIIGAKQNNCSAMGVTYGYGSEDELASAQADYICHSPEDIINFFQS